MRPGRGGQMELLPEVLLVQPHDALDERLDVVAGTALQTPGVLELEQSQRRNRK